jgi:hypothetical protein
MDYPDCVIDTLYEDWLERQARGEYSTHWIPRKETPMAYRQLIWHRRENGDYVSDPSCRLHPEDHDYEILYRRLYLPVLLDQGEGWGGDLIWAMRACQMEYEDRQDYPEQEIPY